MKNTITTNASNEAVNPSFCKGAVSGSCSFLSKPNRIRVNNHAHEFLSGRNTITANGLQIGDVADFGTLNFLQPLKLI
jgi:hypothetical protein